MSICATDAIMPSTSLCSCARAKSVVSRSSEFQEIKTMLGKIRMMKKKYRASIGMVRMI
jgi:hypothetical protein